MEPKPIVRLYSGSDAHMTERARVVYTLFNDALAQFTNFNSTLDADFANDFILSVDAAGLVVADNSVVGQQEQLTEAVMRIMDKARTQYKELKLFIKDAFPDSYGTHHEFGTDKYAEARRSADEMVDFLDELYKASVKYTPQLLAKGYSQVRIDAISNTREELMVANNDQEVFISGRPKLTEDRISIMNRCYENMVKVNAAAQFVYLDDYAMRKQFVYRSSGTSNDINGDVYEGAVDPQIIKVIEVDGFEEETVFKFYNTGTVPLIFGLSEIEEIMGDVVVSVAPGNNLTKVVAELDPEGIASFLLVKNEDTTIQGSYKVEVEI